MAQPIMSKEDKKWRARDDSWTLMRAEEIKMDKTRLKLAQKEAMNMAKEKEAEVKAIKKIAKKK